MARAGRCQGTDDPASGFGRCRTLGTSESMPRIMIVDDDPATLQSLSQILEEEGHTVDGAPDGQVALRHFAGNPADLVICDVYMPNMNGIEFVIRVREAFSGSKDRGPVRRGLPIEGLGTSAPRRVPVFPHLDPVSTYTTGPVGELRLGQ